MVSQSSGRHLESFLEAVRFILTEYGPVSSHGESICLDFEFQGGTLSPKSPKNIGVRGSPERDILPLGAMGLGPGRFPALFRRRVRFFRFL